ncbi:MAG: VWA domain-containing protein [Epsilonproteobacteria bacterium]|nr:VWA domain-containing protein [Campylobacterota bacterium]
MQHFEFEHPLTFLLLLLIVCIYRCPLTIKKIPFVHLHLFGKTTNWIHREKLLLSTILALMVTALATPITYDAIDSQHRKGRDLIFALDTSGSMDESGFSEEQKQESKFSVLLDLIKSFITYRYDDNVGVVVFGSYAFSPSPITYDMHALSYMLDFLSVGMAGDSTAIGDGLDRSLYLLRNSEAKNRVIILITDGYQNSGVVKIKDAITQAKKMGVRIYTIGIGKKNSYDGALLEQIAKDTDAKSFEAQDAKALQDIYEQLDTLEPSNIRSEHYLNRHQLFTYPLAMAILLLLYLLSKRRVL